MRSFRIGIVAPLVLALFFVVDGGARLVPLDVFAFRAWETVVVDPAPTGPFAANKSYFNLWSYGDLSSMGNQPHLRQYRAEHFTTDAYGYRNPPELAEGTPPPAALFLGDSFGSGAGNSDEVTLPAQLGRLLGGPVYNLSGGPLASLGDIRVAARRLHFTRGVLVYELFERNGPPGIPAPPYATFKDVSPNAAPSFSERVQARATNMKISRAEIVVAKWKKAWLAWANHEAAPPPHPDVVVGALDDGSPMIFLRHEINIVASERALPPDYFVWLARELAAHQIALEVVLVPSKYSVYAAHLAPQGLPPPTTGPLERLTSALEAAGITTVNLTGPLRAEAEAAYPRGELLYWRDDTHWNEAGIRVAAREVARRLPEARVLAPDAVGPR